MEKKSCINLDDIVGELLLDDKTRAAYEFLETKFEITMNISKECREQKISLKQLSKKSGVKIKRLVNFLIGDGDLKVYDLYKIAKAFDKKLVINFYNNEEVKNG